MPSYSLVPRQRALYRDTGDIWERTRIADIDGKRTPGAETWVRVATGVPYYHQQTDNILQQTPVGAAVEPSILTTDHAHLPLGVPLEGNPGKTRAQVLVNTTTGSPKNGAYAILGPATQVPSAGNRQANKQSVMVRLQEFPDPALAHAIINGPLTPGTLSVTPLEDLIAGTVIVLSQTSSSLVLSVASTIGGNTPYRYLFQIAPHNSTAWADVAPQSTSNTATATNLNPSTSYDMRCIITDADGGQVVTTTVTGTTLPPFVVGVLSVTAHGSTSVTLSWTSASGGAPSYTYQPQYKESTSSTWLNFGSPISSTTVQVTGLTPVDSYDFRVVMSDALATSLPSNTVTQATDTPTPAEFVAAFNALNNAGGFGGMTMTGLYVPETAYQTVNAVTTGGNVAGGQSPTGFLKALWKNVVPAYATGSDLTPTAALTFGAPCTAEGFLRAPGLNLLSSTAAAIATLGTADQTAAVTDWPNNLFVDRTRGMTIAGVARLTASTNTFQLGENAGADTVAFGGDIVSGYESLRDPAAGHWPGAQNPASGGSLPVAWDVTYVKTQQTATNKGWSMRERIGRDLVMDIRPSSINPDLLATGRNLYILTNGGQTISATQASNEVRCVMIGSGRMNLAQTRLWNNWVEAQWWCPTNLWKDSRDLLVEHGDSFIQPFDNADIYDPATASHTAHINRGYDGAAALGNVAYVNVSRSGNDLRLWQGPIYRWYEDCDFVHRSRIMVIPTEWINGSTFQQNYDLADMWRALAPDKVKVLMHDEFYGNISEKTAAIPTSLDRLNSEAVALGHADVVFHLIKDASFDSWAWGNGVDIGTDPVNGQQPEYWGGQHPTTLNNKLKEQAVRLAVRQVRGENITAVSLRIKSSAEFVNLDASIVQTSTPSWTPYNYLDATLSTTGMTFESLNVAVATVHPTTGTITGVNAGRAVILAHMPDGGLGAMIAIITGTAPIPTPSYAARWDFSVAANLYQDTARTSLVTADGQSIASPTDVTSNGNNGTQTNSARWPVWKANIQNGLGGALFDGSNDYWLLPQALSPVGPYCYFAVINADASLAALRMIIGRTFAADAFQLAVNGTHKAFTTANLSGGAKNRTSTATADGGAHILEVYFDGATLKLLVDGADVQSIAGSGTITYPNSTDFYAIGAQVLNSVTPASPYKGYMFEIGQIAALISDADRSTFRHALGTKWGITVS